MRKLKSFILHEKTEKSYLTWEIQKVLYEIWRTTMSAQYPICLPNVPTFCPMSFAVKSRISSDMFCLNCSSWFKQLKVLTWPEKWISPYYIYYLLNEGSCWKDFSEKCILQSKWPFTNSSLYLKLQERSKGQAKSKWFFQADVSSKKPTNEFDFTTMIPQVDLLSFVFWKKLKTPKRHFKINWPLVRM